MSLIIQKTIDKTYFKILYYFDSDYTTDAGAETIISTYQENFQYVNVRLQFSITTQTATINNSIYTGLYYKPADLTLNQRELNIAQHNLTPSGFETWEDDGTILFPSIGGQVMLYLSKAGVGGTVGIKGSSWIELSMIAN